MREDMVTPNPSSSMRERQIYVRIGDEENVFTIEYLVLSDLPYEDQIHARAIITLMSKVCARIEEQLGMETVEEAPL
jgi:hypothetical protein